jgi:hypothetical protein
MATTPAEHRKLAKEYRALANSGTCTATARREFLLLVQEHLLLAANPDPLLMPSTKSP